MIKRIRFAVRTGDSEGVAARWRATGAVALGAPADVRPLRVAVCAVLPEFTPDARFDGVGLEWFADEAHLVRFEAWLALVASDVTDDLPGRSGEVVVAGEHVLRGGEWLGRRWRDGGERLKHMAIARRADGLTPAEFSDRWRNRAGNVGAVAIPDAARGQAYVQNHPVPRTDGGEWPYDAVNEVYCSESGLRARIAWFEQAMADDGEQDLVGRAWFVAAREELL